MLTTSRGVYYALVGVRGPYSRGPLLNPALRTVPRWNPWELFGQDEQLSYHGFEFRPNGVPKRAKTESPHEATWKVSAGPNGHPKSAQTEFLEKKGEGRMRRGCSNPTEESSFREMVFSTTRNTSRSHLILSYDSYPHLLCYEITMKQA